MDFENPSTWLSGGAGMVIFGIAYKFLWPLLSASLNSALSASRTSDALMKQIVDERDRAVLRADAADKRVEAMANELNELKTNVGLLTLQLKYANEKIDSLTTHVRKLEGGTQ